MNTSFIRRLWSILSLSVVSLILSSPIWACSIPVFRYALAYWAPDPYEVIVFHRAPLSLREQKIVDKLQNASSGSDSRANVIVKIVDLATSQDETMRKIWQTQHRPKLPWIVVEYPKLPDILEGVWHLRFEDDDVEALLDSPIREEIVRRILDGEVAVWVLLESGLKLQDEAAAHLIESQLKKMEKELKISAPEGNTLVNTAGNTKAKTDEHVTFSMVRLSRKDHNERMLVQMLLHTEWGLKNISKPMAFPIFGRGRVLYALVGDGINEDNIKNACSFLVSWCSCQVKDLSPGIDLLMSVNWDKLIDEPLTGYEASPIIGDSESTAIKTKNPSALKRNILIVVLVQILAVAIATFIVLWRKKRTD